MTTGRSRNTLLAALLAAFSSGATARTQAPQAPAARPNLIVILLDDADVEIVSAMPRLRRLMIERGVSFASNIANTPLCGPSRAVLLSGKYAHNNKVYYNNGAEGGYTPWLAGGYDERSLGPWLRGLGYRTGLFGKYLNDFPSGKPETFVPQGWDDFRGVLSDREAHNNRFTLNENGALKVYEASAGGYQTDVLSERLQGFVRASEAMDDKPFFAFFAPSAPHVPPEPAERHLADLPDVKSPRKPSYDEADVSDKPKALRDQVVPLTPAMGNEIDATYRAMRQSLLAVEDAVEALLKTLAETGEAEKTYIVLTSDNGWMRGEHRIPSEKYAPYEESIRVPLIVTGPGISPGRVVNQVTGTVDLAPTLLDLAGAAPRQILEGDGRSFSPLLRESAPGKARWRESILIEHFGGGAPFRVRSYSGLRSEKDVYIEYASGEKEYYDLRKDPFQLQNRVAALSVKARGDFAQRLAAVKNCAADRCRTAEERPRFAKALIAR